MLQTNVDGLRLAAWPVQSSEASLKISNPGLIKMANRLTIVESVSVILAHTERSHKIKWPNNTPSDPISFPHVKIFFTYLNKSMKIIFIPKQKSHIYHRNAKRVCLFMVFQQAI